MATTKHDLETKWKALTVHAAETATKIALAGDERTLKDLKAECDHTRAASSGDW
jgi:hypothetical protein